MNQKVRPEHLKRPALVYIRQSTLVQVLEHRQSTERQYDLAGLAERLGWDASQIEVIDEDLAHSGASATNRKGFQRLVAQVGLGTVGAVFSLEVSRLARSSADWHRLLDLCALSDTLIIDDDGVYDPNDFNDRLVLGMKGTMSDAERHIMRLRLRGGQLHKAKKGTLCFPSATGYVFDDSGALVLDPDEQVQKAVRLLFERFRLDGSAYAVARYFRRQGLLFPSRRAHKDAPAEIKWRPLTPRRVLQILHNPVYAGAYAYGRRQHSRVVEDGKVRSRSRTAIPREEWHVLLQDAHPGYISWEDHVENLRRLDENTNKPKHQARRGAPREGELLLQGIAICGRCGRRMLPDYRNRESPGYGCSRQRDTQGQCWSTVGRRIDDKVVEMFLEAIAPAELDLSLAVANEVERQADDVDRQWKLRLERARYEAERAQRQYDAVEPENRVVARTLETRWNEKLQQLADIEREYEEARRARKLELSEQDKQAIRALARDLPKLWYAPTTTHGERKQLIRLLVQDVVLSPIDVPTRSTRIQILWKTGATSEARIPRPTGQDAHRTPDKVVKLIRRLSKQGLIDTEIANELNRRKLRSGRGRPFTKAAVKCIRREHDILSSHPGSTRVRIPERDDRGRLSARALAKHFDVTLPVVRTWVQKGIIEPERGAVGAPHRFTLTPDVEVRIRQALQNAYGPGGRNNLPPIDDDGRYSTRALMDRYGVTFNIIYRWIEKGVLTPERDRPGSEHRFRLTPDAEQRIQDAIARGRGPYRKRTSIPETDQPHTRIM